MPQGKWHPTGQYKGGSTVVLNWYTVAFLPSPVFWIGKLKKERSVPAVSLEHTL
jgi:hypothetical protein